jgi:REP-associated tyrosine transposase
VEQLSLAVHRLNGLYAMYFNHRHVRRGNVFANRFSAWVIRDEEHPRQALDYVLDNPVKAGLCRSRAEWPWSGPAELKRIAA